jgi:steroid 5-alpha reductase family enzyme
MWKTVLILVFTLIIVPLVAFYFDDPLSALQQATLYKLGKLYLLMSLLCFLISTLSRNYSQVDKLWSIMPIAYVWIVAADAGFDARIVLMALLVSAWGLRLTFNFGRRGGYSWKFWTGEEDYRWAILRAKPEFQPSWKWVLFNLFFISLYQMGLILLMTLPIVESMEGGALKAGDFALAVVFLAFLVIETQADQQQWVYQKEKYRRKHQGEKLRGIYARGFVHTGLWAWVRHPNYMAEQAIWITFYFFSILAGGHWINWSLVGCLLLVVLFKASSDFSEDITAGKYPSYREYQGQVPRFVPRLFRKRLNPSLVKEEE